ncbi:MAG: hypothetical protein WDN25_09695 [Acetobacteraceae bacterium]
MLSGGLAGNIRAGMLPIIAITEALHFPLGLLSGTDNIELDNFFAHFQPLPGGTLVDNAIGNYPFANQAVAANAIIAQPLVLSMVMICPARDRAGYPSKLVTMMALERAITQHNSLGGTYIVVTPSHFYTDLIMTGMRDITRGSGHQVQAEWQLDFVRPLLTLEDAARAQNSLMSKLSNGTQISGQPSWSGLPPTVGDPSSLAAPSVIPAAGGLPAAGTAPLIPVQSSPLPPL